MITPEEIKKQAERWYKDFLIASINGESFFPKEIRFGRIRSSETLESFSKINQEIQNLKKKSKEQSGYGYLIEFIKRKDQKIGEQLFPDRIYFEDESDYLKFIKKEKEYQEFKRAVDQITNTVPELHEWILLNPLKIIDHLGKWTDLIKVCKFFITNPRPNLYIRELPLELHTKFIEENKAIIRHLLDFLIDEYINKEEVEFERRFNLKYSEPLIRLRILDEEIAKEYFSGLTDLSILQSDFNILNISCKKIFILENKTNFSNIFNFLTLPLLKDSMAIFGKGFQLNLLKEARWLSDKQIIYWGDIDTHGFQILSQLRSYFPKTQSLMMDFETFNEFKQFAVTGTETNINQLINLTAEENQLFEYLLDLKEKNRLEQEKINHSFALRKIEKLIVSRSGL
ncbi:hypothetical protein ANME2D_01432 [Candidatus Methanoperedens nitroreducens]|uniref:Wadjet protein JetD C-terminal domain-containing protein n=1 Tax=Candidatus Methanoperedens nitratireducens TaxID=1392998 RepID=A0A062V3X3_9EURY|nr:Wadjet anti-phage system protein JetD domain-containing protein [Candidatus Methanoperedens nitroreducens]KCZ72032.1 hypothetical protein ANME2D_01432 [Candidatus Methanoperedens nitroreducens]MDJ1421993.1 DUF2220 family protein [Candidatus Methanoperedens sp.]